MSMTTKLLMLEAHVSILETLHRRYRTMSPNEDRQSSLHATASLLFCIAHTLQEAHAVLTTLSTLTTDPPPGLPQHPAQSASSGQETALRSMPTLLSCAERAEEADGDGAKLHRDRRADVQ